MHITDFVDEFRRWRLAAEKAIAQVPDDQLNRVLSKDGNSVAMLMRHVGGNLASRFSDFLTADGEKPWRDRDGEFVIGADDTRQRLLAAWEDGWAALFGALGGLTEVDMTATVTIRGEAHTVLQAVHRALTHAAYHAGQILYVARLVQPDGWRWVTVPPGRSQEVRARGGNYLK